MSDREFFSVVAEEVGRNGRVVLATCVGVRGSGPSKLGRRILVRPDGSSHGTIGGGPFEALVLRDAAEMLAAGERSRNRSYDFFDSGKGEPTPMICGGTAEVFLELLEDRPLLYVVGGGHIGQALARFGDALGFAVAIADDRAEYRDPARFPEGTRVLEVDREYRLPFPDPWPKREASVALVTRCWETDRAALVHLLGEADGLQLRYVGMIGSSRKCRKLLGELEAEGWSKERLAAVRAPIGLPIGAVTPEEIAVSILAEIVAVRANAPIAGNTSR
jgi:xanthine dehydrogenase accessory factor